MGFSSNAWSTFWHKGFRTTFAAESGDFYSGKIANFWLEDLNTLDHGNTVIDPGTGAGALLQLMLEWSDKNNKALSLVGIDYADVTLPKPLSEKSNIKLLANTNIESLPMPNNSVHFATSLFGMEYANIEKVSQELKRTLNDGGRLNALLHHIDSDITQQTASALQQINQCDESNLISLSIALLERLERLENANQPTSNDAIANQIRNQINTAAAKLTDIANRANDASHIDFYLAQIGGVFSAKMSNRKHNEKIALLNTTEIECRNYQHRMEAMKQASSSETQIKNHCAVLERNNFSITHLQPMCAANKTLAWELKATLNKN